MERVRAGVIDAGRRMEGPSSSKLLLPIFLRDVLMGTCMRFDRNDTGVLDRDKLEQVSSDDDSVPPPLPPLMCVTRFKSGTRLPFNYLRYACNAVPGSFDRFDGFGH